jgi:hypothetical protein
LPSAGDLADGRTFGKTLLEILEKRGLKKWSERNLEED